MMGTGKSVSEGSKPPQKSQPAKIENPTSSKQSDPNEILNRLNDKNNNQFISAYNAYALGSREQENKKTSIK